jgi:multiple sugar transport system permease protein
MTIPAASMVLVWKILLCPDGVFNQFLAGVTGQVWEVDWAFSRWAFPVLIVTYLWKYDMILWLAGLQGIPGELYEAAKMDGAGFWSRLRYVTVPCLRGTFGLVGILSVVNSFRVYREAYLLAGSYPDTSIYLIPHLFAHWFLDLDVQKMTAAVMLTAAAVVPAVGVFIAGKGKEQ